MNMVSYKLFENTSTIFFLIHKQPLELFTDQLHSRYYSQEPNNLILIFLLVSF